jgi:adenylylsulfate kinase-like enzyme
MGMMMSYYLRNGNTFSVTDRAAMDLHDRLPAGNYIIKQDQYGNFILEQVDSFEHSGKIYGDTLRNVDRIMNTFQSRANSTGVMLSGEKGSGKTLLAKQLSITAAQAGIPTIVINAPWHGDKFNKFIQDIEQPAIVLFDEFEKVYDQDSQEQMLTLLDGVFSSKKLFILTTNDKWRVDKHMRNRPGRIFYMLDFSGLDGDFIREYCTENLGQKEHAESIVRIASMFSQFNFDMLKALVEEMNRYVETPKDALKMLNVKAEFSDRVTYDVALAVTEGELDRDSVNSQWSGNPLTDEIAMQYQTVGDDSDWYVISFETKELRSMDGKTGSFTFVNDDGRLTLTRVKEAKYNYLDLF